MNWREEFERREGESPADHLERLKRREYEMSGGGLSAVAELEALSRALRDARQPAKGMTTLDQLKHLWAIATAEERQAFFLWHASESQPPAAGAGQWRRKE
jgi:hypothetical protein